METLWIGWTTLDTKDSAEALARGLVKARLAACVQIDGPIQSVYRWQGAVEQGAEWRLWVKFPGSKASALEQWLAEQHPYETPQWVALPAESVGAAYHAWARESTGD
ncbi:MAG: divalent-cation tolerance protein CutA [Opitutales bacterium]